MEEHYKDYYTFNGYNITTDPEMNRKRYGITPQLQKQIDKLYFECRSPKNKKIVDKIKQLIIAYPDVPQLKNFLSIVYLSQKKIDLVEETNKQILEQHPNYIFGQINMANLYIDQKKFDKVPEILGAELELKKLCPERDIFHLAELTNFLKVVIRYYAVIEDLENAEKRLEFMKEVAPDHPDTETAETFLFPLRLANFPEKLRKEREAAIIPVVLLQAQETDFNEPPLFKHFEMQYLYQYGIDITHEKLNELLRLPQESFMQDLEEVLSDAIRRYGYFKKQEWKEESHTFVVHAIMLLGELKAEKALPSVLNFLSYDSDFLDFWLGEHLTETIWQCIFKMGEHQTQILGTFLQKPGIETYCKSLVSEALCQIVHHHPERKTEISALFANVFECFITAKSDDNLIDSDFLGMLIWDVLDAQLHELRPLIKQIFEMGRVNESICGSLKQIETDFDKPPAFEKKKEILNILELYDHILNTWWGYNNDEAKDGGYDDYDAKPFRHTEVKVGRNDPCPCGSGKKYKKCCL